MIEFIHRFVPATDAYAPTLVALHGTGGDEAALIPLARAIQRELPSEPMALGSVQVPAGGHPIVFGADHPATGGYPVIAVLTDASIDRAAQLAPGQRVRFRVRA